MQTVNQRHSRQSNQATRSYGHFYLTLRYQEHRSSPCPLLDGSSDTVTTVAATPSRRTSANYLIAGADDVA